MIFPCAQNLIPQKGFGLPRIGIKMFFYQVGFHLQKLSS